jgi:hypothetical protein
MIRGNGCGSHPAMYSIASPKAAAAACGLALILHHHGTIAFHLVFHRYCSDSV